MKINKAIATLVKFVHWNRSNEDIDKDVINSVDTVLDALRWRKVEEEMPPINTQLLCKRDELEWDDDCHYTTRYFTVQPQKIDLDQQSITHWLPIPRKEEK